MRTGCAVTLIDCDELADATGMNRRGIPRLARSGKIPGARKDGKIWVFDRGAICEWLGVSDINQACRICVPFPGLSRNQHQMDMVREHVLDVLREERPATCRNVFYRLVGRGVVHKTENEYQNTVLVQLANMRRSGELPWSWIVDNTRIQRIPTLYQDLDDAITSWQHGYRRNLWEDQDDYVEIWCEKDALTGVLYGVTREYGVPLMISRGFSSLSFLHSAAETIANVRKPAYLYYFGDRDPSGVEIDRKIEEELRSFAPGAEIHFERVAVLEHQIEELGLPTRPTKKTKHGSNFKGESVELDSIPPSTLRQMCREVIEQHIDREALRQTSMVEAQEKRLLNSLLSGGLSR